MVIVKTSEVSGNKTSHEAGVHPSAREQRQLLSKEGREPFPEEQGQAERNGRAITTGIVLATDRASLTPQKITNFIFVNKV